MLDLLKGVRVIENALLLNGDMLGMQFVGLGAEVIKMEDTGAGDYLRNILTQFAPGRSPAHLHVNKNKKSIAVNVKTPQGKEIFWRLLATTDIYLDGLRAGASDRLGIGYDAQRAVKPDIIYVQHTGYGASGPYAAIPTHGVQMNALAGGMPGKLGPDGHVVWEKGSQYLGGSEETSSPTMLGALHAAMAAIAALVQRNRTGEGAYIDVAAADALIATSWMGVLYNLNYEKITNFTGFEQRTPDYRYDHKWPKGSARYELYPTQDGKIMLFCAIEKKFWDAFCHAVERPDLIDTMTPGLAVDYGADKPWLRDALRDIFAAKPQAYWVELAARVGIPMGPAPTLPELPHDPHLQTRDIFYQAQDPEAGPHLEIDFPAVVAGHKQARAAPAPNQGQHTAEVLAMVGYDASDIDDLKAAGVVR